MKKVLVTAKLLKFNEDRISKLWDAKLNMNNEENPSPKSLHKQKLKEKKLKNLAAKLKSNIAKRKQSKLRNQNG